ncbi:hypothetical protein O3M35_010146 [Rhynocoris fuscipes]|uniref:Uncharacterized protein n=1 Tax=Rhynocoris fuscipes TaxID=488301 RepID=A0AAW1CYU1_9HEMI
MAEKTAVILYLSFSIFGVLLGFSAVIAFSVLDNSWAEFWSLLSGTYALMNAYLYYLVYKKKLDAFYNISELRNINCFATISTIVYSGALVWYIFEIIYYKLPSLPVNESYPIIAVWCFMTVKWALALSFSTQRQIKILSNSGRALLQT